MTQFLVEEASYAALAVDEHYDDEAAAVEPADAQYQRLRAKALAAVQAATR